MNDHDLALKHIETHVRILYKEVPIWRLPEMGVPPRSSILDWYFSLITLPFWGYPQFMETILFQQEFPPPIIPVP